MVDVVIKTYHSLPCACDIFTINGWDADRDDFGQTEDLCPDAAAEYGCGNRQFVPKMPTKEILKKYNIDVDEYSDICDELKLALDVGKCGWCI